MSYKGQADAGAGGFVGFAVISKVPNTLHTPLMSGTTNVVGGSLVTDRMLGTFKDRDKK